MSDLMEVDDVVNRARLYASTGAPTPQDQLGWAKVCLAQGLPHAARRLVETAWLRQGFSRQLLSTRASQEADGVFRPKPPQAPVRVRSQGTVEIALSELREFARARGASRAASTRRASEPASASLKTDSRGLTSAAALEEGASQLFLFLSTPDMAQDRKVPEKLIQGLGEMVHRSVGFDRRAFAGASLPLLASALVFSGVCEFMRDERDLMQAPLGSAEFLHDAARLDSVGLGPYLGNVQQIASKSADVFELAHLAAEVGGSEVGVEPWVTVLSRRLSGPLLLEVIDDLGDRNAGVALSAIFDRAAAAPAERLDRALILRLRDTALDNLDYELASRAQGLIVRLNPEVMLERLILGTIDASAGRRTAAEQTFLGLLKETPQDEQMTAELIERLSAVRSRSFERFAITQGFFSPKDRQIKRLRRRVHAKNALAAG